MNYISTRGGIDPVPFKDAVMMGLATDGGLLVPEHIPNITDKLESWRFLSFPELAFEVISCFVSDIKPDDLRGIIERSYATFDHPDVTPVIKAGSVHILELFHGPTQAFKDVALQFLGNVFEFILKERGGHLNILGATSGDTGSAAIHGVRGKDNINIFIMHPQGKTSPIQALQMTSVLDDNVHNISVEGSFDDCQALMKGAFNDLNFKNNNHLGAVNSVNWARIVAQITYYFWGHFQVSESVSEKVSFSVPTGNFGDIFAGYLAQRMGLPIEKLLLATNENNILTTFFTTGHYKRGKVSHTVSPSMDIQVASNFERYLYYFLHENSTRLKEVMSEFSEKEEVHLPCENAHIDPLFESGSAPTKDTLEVIQRYFKEYEYLLDPHSAVGVKVAETFAAKETKTVCLATAHPAKFPDAIYDALGKDCARHPKLDVLKGAKTRCSALDNNLEALQNFVVSKIQQS